MGEAQVTGQAGARAAGGLPGEANFADAILAELVSLGLVVSQDGRVILDPRIRQIASDGDAASRATALLEAAVLHRRVGKTTAAVEALTQALGLLDDGATKERGRALRLLGLARRDTGDIEAAIASHTQAEYVFGVLGDVQSQVREHCSLGRLHLEQGRLDDAQRSFVHVLEGRSNAMELGPILVAQAGLVEVRARRGDTADAIDTLNAGLSLARNDALKDAEAASLAALSFVEGLVGDAAKADAAYDAAAEIYRSGGAHRATAMLHAQAAERRAVRGDVPGAQQALRAGESVVGGRRDASIVAQVAIARGAVLEQAGDLTAALASYWEAVDAARRAGATYADRKAAILSAQLDPDQTRALGYLRSALVALAAQGDRALFILRPALAMWLSERVVALDIRTEDRPGVDALLTVPADDQATTHAGGLQVSLLGTLDVRVGGTRISDRAWRTSKAKELFSLLLLTRERALGRDEIIERLWPETEPGSGISNFHFTLHALRKALATAKGPAAPTVRTEGGYQLVTSEKPPVDVDVFALLLHEAHRFRRAGRPDDAVRLFKATTALYRGDLLTDLEAEWVAERREDILRQYLSALRQLAELEIEREEPAAAVGPCQKYLEREPYDEHVHRLLMRAYHASGDTALVERHYRSLVALLQRELSASPERETTELFETLRGGARQEQHGSPRGDRKAGPLGALAPLRARAR